MTRPSRHRLTRAVATFATATTAGAALRRAWHGRRASLRGLSGRLRGWAYHAIGGRPRPDVGDDTVAERVRAALGPVTKRLDLPRVDVAVANHIVLLHGSVGTEEDADALEAAADQVSGVEGVLSYLHVGLPPGYPRPSEGAVDFSPSPALRCLLDAARQQGVPDPLAPAAVRAVLGSLFERLPDGTRRHLLAHLPADVQVVVAAPRRRGPMPRLRRFGDFVDVVLAAEHVDGTDPESVAAAVIRALRDLVPDEARHVAAVLPPVLRTVWAEPSHA